jgi:hypothetical protein
VTVYFDFSDYGVPTLPGSPLYYVLLYRNSTAANFTIVPGTTCTVTGDEVLFKIPASTITTNYYYTIGTKSVSPSPLPVELISFDASPFGNGVNTSWTTVTEQNSNYFSVERSFDALQYDSIGFVKAAGNSNSTRNYQLFDAHPLRGISYYRLKQVNLDHSFTYSSPVDVNLLNEGGVGIYPNPGSSMVNVVNCSGYDKLFVMDGLGRLAATFDVKGNMMGLNLSELPDGIYFFTLFNNATQNKSVLKFIKQSEH